MGVVLGLLFWAIGPQNSPELLDCNASYYTINSINWIPKYFHSGVMSIDVRDNILAKLLQVSNFIKKT